MYLNNKRNVRMKACSALKIVLRSCISFIACFGGYDTSEAEPQKSNILREISAIVEPIDIIIWVGTPTKRTSTSKDALECLKNMWTYTSFISPRRSRSALHSSLSSFFGNFVSFAET